MMTDIHVSLCLQVGCGIPGNMSKRSLVRRTIQFELSAAGESESMVVRGVFKVS